MVNGETHLFTVLSHLTSSPKWTLKARAIDHARIVSPGPGEYDLVASKSSMLNAPRFSIASSRRKMKYMSTPGPGAYQAEKPRNIYSVTFGVGSRRFDLGNCGRDSPGPAAYDTSSPTTKRSSSEPSKIQRPSPFRDMITPGPGEYSPEPVKSRKSVLFGTSRRGSMRTFQTPGPAAYDTAATLVDKSHGVSFKARHPARVQFYPMFSDDEEEPLTRRSHRATAKKVVTYFSSSSEADSLEEEEEVVAPNQTKKAKVNGKKSAVPQKKKAAKVVSEESSELAETDEAAMDEDEDDVPQGMVVKSKQTKIRSGKEQLVADLLCRWWYALPVWPPQDCDYSGELSRRGLVQVTLDDWEELPDVDHKTQKTKCYALSQFPGVFRDARGGLVDCRPNEGKPSYNNFMAKTEKELATLLVKAYEKQMQQLGDTDPDLTKELKERLNKVRSMAGK